MSEPSGEYYDWTITRKPERPWLIPYHQTLVMKLILCRKSPEGGPAEVYLTFAEALEVIRKLDNITLEIPKIVYLVGWQFDGHDSKYPALDGVNEALKREQDETALSSLRWLITESRKFHTTVSLHINMFDAYEDSPLWETYVKNDIVAKDKDGNVIFGEMFDGQRSAQLSYKQEWDLGFTRKRIDGLLEMIPELEEGHTIHIDAFHTARPLDREEPISPLLGCSMEEEAAAQRKIYRYFRDRGIDATSEGSGFLRPDRFVGLQPMAWWASREDLADLEPELYCSTPMHAETEVMKDPENLPGLIDQFCLMVVPWYFRNAGDDTGGYEPKGELKELPKRQLTFEEALPEYGTDVFMPALWKEDTIVAYSYTGYSDRIWELPESWNELKIIDLFRITLNGPEKIGQLPVEKGSICLSLEKRDAFVLSPGI